MIRYNAGRSGETVSRQRTRERCWENCRFKSQREGTSSFNYRGFWLHWTRVFSWPRSKMCSGKARVGKRQARSISQPQFPRHLLISLRARVRILEPHGSFPARKINHHVDARNVAQRWSSDFLAIEKPDSHLSSTGSHWLVRSNTVRERLHDEFAALSRIRRVANANETLGRFWDFRIRGMIELTLVRRG